MFDDTSHPMQVFDVAVGRTIKNKCTPHNQVPPFSLKISPQAQATMQEAVMSAAWEMGVYPSTLNRILKHGAACHIVDKTLIFILPVPDIADLIIEIPASHWQFRFWSCELGGIQ